MRVTRARTSAFGSRALVDVTVEPIPVIETNFDGNGGWYDHRDGFRCHLRPDGNIRQISFRNAKEDIRLEFYNLPTSFPSSVEIRDWEVTSSAPRRLRRQIYLDNLQRPLKATHGEVYRDVEITSYTADGEELFHVCDRNSDGRYDSFTRVSLDGTRRIEEDRDYDGLLDTVEIRTKDGSKTILAGEQLPERKVRTVQIPKDRIRALIDRAKAGLPEL